MVTDDGKPKTIIYERRKEMGKFNRRTNTTQFRFSYGKEPRGCGMWGFEVTGTDGQGKYTSEKYFLSGMLGDVKKEAVRRFKKDISGIKRVTEVKVLP